MWVNGCLMCAGFNELFDENDYIGLWGAAIGFAFAQPIRLAAPSISAFASIRRCVPMAGAILCVCGLLYVAVLMLMNCAFTSLKKNDIYIIRVSGY